MNTQTNTIQSISVVLHGLDANPTEIHLNKITKRADGEYLYYDEQNNVMLFKPKDGILHIKLALARAYKK